MPSPKIDRRREGGRLRFMTTSPYSAAIPHLLDWCDEASVVHWVEPDETLPSWIAADKRMRESGRPSRVRNPSPQHATLSYNPPRAAGGAANPTTVEVILRAGGASAGLGTILAQ